MSECVGPKAQIWSEGDSTSALAPGPFSNAAFPRELYIVVYRVPTQIEKMVLPVTPTSRKMD